MKIMTDLKLEPRLAAEEQGYYVVNTLGEIRGVITRYSNGSGDWIARSFIRAGGETVEGTFDTCCKLFGVQGQVDPRADSYKWFTGVYSKRE